MANKKPASSTSIIVLGMLGGGLAAVEIGQQWHAIEASQPWTLLAIGAGALLGGAVTWGIRRTLTKSAASPGPSQPPP